MKKFILSFILLLISSIILAQENISLISKFEFEKNDIQVLNIFPKNSTNSLVILKQLSTGSSSKSSLEVWEVDSKAKVLNKKVINANHGGSSFNASDFDKNILISSLLKDEIIVYAVSKKSLDIIKYNIKLKELFDSIESLEVYRDTLILLVNKNGVPSLIEYNYKHKAIIKENKLTYKKYIVGYVNKLFYKKKPFLLLGNVFIGESSSKGKIYNWVGRYNSKKEIEGTIINNIGMCHRVFNSTDIWCKNNKGVDVYSINFLGDNESNNPIKIKLNKVLYAYQYKNETLFVVKEKKSGTHRLLLKYYDNKGVNIKNKIISLNKSFEDSFIKNINGNIYLINNYTFLNFKWDRKFRKGSEIFLIK